MQETGHLLRIGELGRRAGVTPELLRAWERRYNLLQPIRTPGGFRLYSSEDEQRVRLMQDHLGRGLSAAEAAALALAGGRPASPAASPTQTLAEELREALDALDGQRGQLALDRLLAAFTTDTVISEVVIPYLHDLGDRWERGEASVAQEHFASNLLRGRLLGLARGWDLGTGPRVLLACAPGEQHDLPLIAFGLALHGRGWRILFLGADTPVASLLDATERLKPSAVVVSATTSERFEALAAEPPPAMPLVIAGAGATAELAERVGGVMLEGDPVSAAERLVPRRG